MGTPPKAIINNDLYEKVLKTCNLLISEHLRITTSCKFTQNKKSVHSIDICLFSNSVLLMDKFYIFVCNADILNLSAINNKRNY